MKKIIILMFIILVSTMVMAEDWNKVGDISITMNQNSYSDNWSGEEKGSISWVFNANFLAEKQLTAKVHNKNTLKLAFGQTHNQYEYMKSDSTFSKKWAKPDKSTDLIDYESMFRFTLGSIVDPYASLRLESQFLDQSVIDDAKIFNPMTLTEALGIAKVFIKDDTQELSTRLGAAFKQYMNSHWDEGQSDGGVEFVGIYMKPLKDNMIKYSSNLNLYKPLIYSESDAVEGTDMEDAWKQIRMNWQHDVDVSLTKLVNLKLYVQLLYNEMIIDEIQVKETLGLGLSYKLF